MPNNTDDEGYRDCDNCGDTVDEREIVYDDGDHICQPCYESREEDRNQYDDEQSEYIHDHDYKPMPLFHNDNGKCSREPALVNTFPKPYVGLEIEIESTRSASLSEYAEMVADNCAGLVYNKSDGSISHGFEMVTHPMTLGYAQNHLDGLWESFARLRRAGFRAWQTSTCGLHIHISRNSFLDDKHQQKFLYFIYGPAKADIKKFAGRDSTWSKFDKDAFCASRYEDYSKDLPSLMEVVKGRRKDGSPVPHQASERYLAVNRNNRHTLELRFFRPSLRPDTVLACIEFTYCLWAYTEQVTSHQALRQNALTDFEQFAIYARKHRATYPKLVAHLVRRGVSVDPDAEQPTVDGEE